MGGAPKILLACGCKVYESDGRGYTKYCREHRVPTHEHFCSECYGHKNGGGWWGCNRKKCALPMSARCHQHHAQSTRGSQHG